MASIDRLKWWIAASVILGVFTYVTYNSVNTELGLFGFTVFVFTLFTTIKKAVEGI